MNKRPAEVATGVAAALAVVITRLLGTNDPDIFTALVVLIAAVPSAVTWLVESVRSKGVTHFQSTPE